MYEFLALLVNHLKGEHIFLALVTDRIDREATAQASDAEAAKSIAAYRENRMKNGYSAEELHEMRAAFGPGAKVKDILTGKTIKL